MTTPASLFMGVASAPATAIRTAAAATTAFMRVESFQFLIRRIPDIQYLSLEIKVLAS